MADRTARTGQRARWTSMVVLAPGAAAVFGATVSWAATSTPTTATTATGSTTTSTTAAAAQRPATASVRHGLSTEARQWRAVTLYRAHQRHVLATELAAVRKHVALLRKAERAALRAARHPVVAAQTGGYSGGYAGGAPVAAAPVVSGPAVQAPAAPAPYVPAPAAPAPAPVVVQAPPVQATTGGSGHP